MGPSRPSHFKTLLREILEGDKEEAYAESSQKLTNARQRKIDTVNEFYDFTYKLHIRLRTLDKERAMTELISSSLTTSEHDCFRNTGQSLMSSFLDRGS